MSSIISILSKIPNIGKELARVAPNLAFKDISTAHCSYVDADNVQLLKSEIIIADFDLLIPYVNSLTQTKWIQGTWAGLEKFLPHLDKEKNYPFIISRFSGKHFGRLMSEYVVSHIINHERTFFGVYDNKKQKNWSQEDQISQHRSIADLTVGILGVGNIGNHIARTLHSFGAKIWGFGRRDILPISEEYKHYEKYCTVKTLPNLLKNCDYVVNVLPSTDETKGLLNGNIFENCSGKQTVFINIGRGNIIKEEDLIHALKSKWLSAAILDVFETEPLPKDSELWNLKQVFITPHVAGVSRAKDIAEQFLENFECYKNGEKILTQVSIGQKY